MPCFRENNKLSLKQCVPLRRQRTADALNISRAAEQQYTWHASPNAIRESHCPLLNMIGMQSASLARSGDAGNFREASMLHLSFRTWWADEEAWTTPRICGVRMAVVTIAVDVVAVV
jgi:hypothetical protein